VETLEEFGELFRVEQHLKKKIMDNNTMMKCIIIVTRMIKEALQLLQQMFNKLKRKMQQLPITMSSKRWKKNLSTFEESQPSKSSAPQRITVTLR